MTLPFTKLMRALYRVPHTAVRDNPYRHRLLRTNLRHYLAEMLARQPSTLLVGEALGYRGGRWTGIPFTSEQLIENGVAHFGLFGAGSPYRLLTTRSTSEQSATIVWQTLAQLDFLPLLWNAYPFHPHRADQRHTNRPPTRDELVHGGQFLRLLLAAFPITTLVAVGHQASRSLHQLQLPHVTVRHPAHGGKADFVAGLKQMREGATGATER